MVSRCTDINPQFQKWAETIQCKLRTDQNPCYGVNKLAKIGSVPQNYGFMLSIQEENQKLINVYYFEYLTYVSQCQKPHLMPYPRDGL